MVSFGSTDDGEYVEEIVLYVKPIGRKRPLSLKLWVASGSTLVSWSLVRPIGMKQREMVRCQHIATRGGTTNAVGTPPEEPETQDYIMLGSPTWLL